MRVLIHPNAPAWAAVFLTLVFSWFSWQQWKQTRRSIELARESNENAKLSVRPWVGYEEFQGVVIQEGRKFEGALVFINSGNSPALHISKCVTSAGHFEPPEPGTCGNREVTTAGIIVPGGRMRLPFQPQGPLPEPTFLDLVLTAKDIKDLKAERERIYVTGWIQYQDAFDVPKTHTLTYCWVSGDIDHQQFWAYNGPNCNLAD
jgi:hypothetical protein